MKPVFQALVAFIVIAAIGALILSFTLDGIVKSNVENTTSELLETSVNVDDVSISLIDGSGTIEGITVSNPEGFSEKAAMQFQQISIKMELSSLLSDTIVVNEIRIQQPNLYFEQKASGNNFDALTAKLQGASSSGSTVVIDYLLVENGQVTLTTDIGGDKSAKGEFSQIEIENIGRDGNNTMEQTVQQVLEPILQRALQEAVEQGLMDKAKEKLKDLLDS